MAKRPRPRHALAVELGAASACSRRCPRATERLPCTGRSRAWPSAGKCGCFGASGLVFLAPPRSRGRRRRGSRSPQAVVFSSERRDKALSIEFMRLSSTDRKSPYAGRVQNQVRLTCELSHAWSRSRRLAVWGSESTVTELRAGEQRLAQRRPRRAARLFLAVVRRGTSGRPFISFCRRRPRVAEQVGPRQPGRIVVARLARSLSANALGLADDERIVHQIQRLGGNGRRRPLADDQARIGEVEQRQRLGQPDRGRSAGRRCGACRSRSGRRRPPRKRKPTLPSPPRATELPFGGVRSSRPLSASIVSRSASASSRRFGIRQTQHVVRVGLEVLRVELRRQADRPG